MARLRSLEKALGELFRAPAKRNPDVYRHSRRSAKALSKQHCIEIEKLDGGGFNVWPPAAIADTPRDVYAGDHYAADWKEADEMVREYVKLLQEGDGGGAPR